MGVFRVFIRTVYTLGESPDSSAVEFRTTSHDGASDHSLDGSRNKDPPDDGSKPGWRDERDVALVGMQPVPVHSVNSPVTERGDEGSKKVSTHQVLRQNDNVKPDVTYPSGEDRSPEHAVEVTGLSLKGPLDCWPPDDAEDTLPTSKVKVEGSHLIAATAEVQNRSEEEPKFVPKPPDENAVPRRNSFTRLGSLHRKADSGSSQHVESRADSKTGAISGPMNAENRVLDSFTADAGNQTDERPHIEMECSSDSSHTTMSCSESSPEDLARNTSHELVPSGYQSSLGVVMSQSDETKDRATTVGKPPARRWDSSVDQGSPACVEDNALAKNYCDKTESEAVLKAGNEKSSSSRSHIPRPKKNDSGAYEIKMLSGHKR